jgi:hypothetical protein
MHFSHLFDFVKIHYKTSFVGVVFLDAFAAKHSEMVGAVEVHHSLVMFLTEQTVDAIFIFEIYIS